MNERKLKVLLIIEQCNPEWPSVPLVGYNYLNEISKRTEATLITHERNKPALEKVRLGRKFIYIPESRLSKKYYRFAAFLAIRKSTNWPLLHTSTLQDGQNNPRR